jgi:NAD(P)-dependent dehydrogenase (short-subunit alcohol dehydrogenase family)
MNAQQQSPPGSTALMEPVPDHGEHSYVGHGRLEGKKAIITGGDSGIGRAVAIAFAREGADVLIAYLEEDDDAADTARWVAEAGREAPLVRGDLADPAHCRRIVDEAADAFGRVDVLVNNAAFQRTYTQLEDIPDEEWDRHFQTNVSAMFHLC